MITVIIANGTLDHSPNLDALLEQADLLIAADGGANHCAELSITPDILLGDLDSINPAILATYESGGVAIHRFPRRKDATDLELALDLAIEKGARAIWLIGTLGGRWDMSLANIMLAASDKYKGQKIFLLGQDCSMRIMHPGKVYTINSTPGQKVSFLPLKSDVHGVTLSGFEYPLTHHTIPFGSSLGVSNILKNNRATVQHTEGVLLCVLFSE
ncbi:MAG: thiamine diphosphokinase [Desulforhopalus sp.]|nr:thiamine diphosphokinase [Desulforhopalus sp.]